MQNIIQKIALCGVMILSIFACSDNNDSPANETYSFSVQIINMTYAQPLSAPVAMLHDKSFKFWRIGEPASLTLETLEEGANGSGLPALQPVNPQFEAVDAVPAGGNVVFTLQTTDATQPYLCVAGMLINPNDAFSGVNSIELDGLSEGQTRVYNTYAYDRDDVTSVVTLHGGVVSANDNFNESTPSAADKFDNPTLRIIVTAL